MFSLLSNTGNSSDNKTLNNEIDILDTSQTNTAQNPTDSKSSIGNEGVGFEGKDRQTDIRQTYSGNIGVENRNRVENKEDKNQENKDVFNVLNQLREQIQTRFKGLTKQELKVFSLIYILEREGPVDYKLLSEKASISESSIRDYIMKLERKGIPIIKEKINNKKVLLKIRQELKSFTTLDAILKLREFH